MSARRWRSTWDGNGIQTRSINDGVQFDMNNDGDADKTAWLGAGDAFLALDKNGDGVIGNQSELFGDEGGAHKDGFANLASYDQNGDGKIDASDSIFADLRLWKDVNGDGISQSDELFGLSDFSIASINLDAQQVHEDLGADTGIITARSSFTFEDGHTGAIVDIGLAFIDQHDDLTASINEFVHGDPEGGPAVVPTPGNDNGQPAAAAQDASLLQQSNPADIIDQVQQANQAA